MPNWTNNTITFKSEEDCKKVWEAMCLETFAKKALPDGNYAKYKTKRFTYEAVIPSPKTKKECPKEYLMNEESYSQALEDRPWFDWYRWNSSNWGVKWDACDAYQDYCCIYFDSPWSKPYNEVFQAIADKFNVSFYTEHINEGSGWEEYKYHYSPHQPMYSEISQWQIDENQSNRENEW